MLISFSLCFNSVLLLPMCDFDFAKWGQSFGLKDTTLVKLEKEDLITGDVISDITDEDILKLKITIGESKKLQKAVQSLKPKVSTLPDPSPAAVSPQDVQAGNPHPEITLKTIAANTDIDDDLSFLKDILRLKSANSESKGEKPLYIKDFVFGPLKQIIDSSSDDDEELFSSKTKKVVLKQRPKIDEFNLKPEEWAGANFRILRLICQREGITCQTLLDYIDYSINVADYLQTFAHPQVLRFDKNHRKQVAQYSKRWNDVDPHLDRLFLHVLPTKRQVRPQQKTKPQRFYDNFGNEICTKFNTTSGCTFPQCKYRHVCYIKGCWSTNHGRSNHGETVAPRFAADKNTDY